MLKTLDRFYIGAKIRMANFADQFKKDETGVSSIVATDLDCSSAGSTFLG